MINLFHPFIAPEAKEAVGQVLDSRWIGQGPMSAKLEKDFADKFNYRHPVLLSSGTAGLHLALILAGVKAGDRVLTTASTCLGYQSRVMLADGTTEAIGKIVNQKRDVDVVSFNIETGKFETKKVTNWIKLPAQKKWYRVNCKNGRGARGEGGRIGIWVTGDHKILTKRGYVRTDELTDSDMIATGQIQPSSQQMEFINGTMLGDGYIRHESTNGHSRYGITHNQNQKYWLKLKEKALRGFHLTYFEKEAYKQSGPSCGIMTDKSLCWKNIRKDWYSTKNTRIVPDNLEITPLMLSTWYMDDGSLSDDSVVLCTEALENESYWKLFYKLVDYGLKPRSRHSGNKKRISFTREESVRFFSIISKYIPECMRYKLPDGYDDFDENLWNLDLPTIMYDYVSVEEGIPVDWNKTSNVYCLEVEDNHNFVAGGIVVSNCTATNHPILQCGAKPVWGDIQYQTGNLNPDLIDFSVIRNVKAIMVVHWAGYPADMDKFDKISKIYGIPVIQDGAHAIGATFKGKPLDRWSDYLMHSFQAIKTITTIDGGILMTSTGEKRQEAIRRRWFGIDRDNRYPADDGYWTHELDEVGYKYQPNDVLSAIGLANLPYFDQLFARRKEICWMYRDGLRDVPGVTLLENKADRESGCWLFTMHVENRDEFFRKMTVKGIETSVIHRRNDIYSVFGGRVHNLPNLDKWEKTNISIPLHNKLSNEDVDYIIQSIKSGW